MRMRLDDYKTILEYKKHLLFKNPDPFEPKELFLNINKFIINIPEFSLIFKALESINTGLFSDHIINYPEEFPIKFNIYSYKVQFLFVDALYNIFEILNQYDINDYSFQLFNNIHDKDFFVKPYARSKQNPK